MVRVFLNEVINQFFDENKTGTRTEIIKYINDYLGDSDSIVVNKQGDTVVQAYRTTIFENLQSMGCYCFKVKNNAESGRSEVYFFRPCDERVVKNKLLSLDVTLKYSLKIINCELAETVSNRYQRAEELNIPGHRYYEIINLFKRKKIPLEDLKDNEEMLTNLIWKEYLEKLKI